MKYEWKEEDKFAFATQRIRAVRIPDKKKQANKKACRGRIIP